MTSDRPAWLRAMAHKFWLWLYIDRYEHTNPAWMRALRCAIIWTALIAFAIGLAVLGLLAQHVAARLGAKLWSLLF